MSRFTDAERILAAAEVWKERCLLGQGSLFSERRLWTRERFEELDRVYMQATKPEGTGDFMEALEQLLKPASEDAKCLFAEMAWVVYLIDSHTKPATKRDRIGTIWGWSGRDVPGHQLLEPDTLGAGVVWVAHRQVQEEYNSLVSAMLDWTGKDRGKRRSLIGAPWDFAAWLDGTKYAQGRMLRHALLFLLFPDTFEPIVSSGAKKTIVNNLGRGGSGAIDGRRPGADTKTGQVWELADKHQERSDTLAACTEAGINPSTAATQYGHWLRAQKDSGAEDAVAIDRRLLEIRDRLEREALRLGEPAEVHFYHSPYREMWDAKRADDWFKGRFGDGDAREWVLNMNIHGERMWPGVAEDGIASIGWDKVPDLREFKSRDELVTHLKPEVGAGAARYLWQFGHDMKPGDLVIAVRRRGRSRYRGWGIVSGDYRYHPHGAEFRVHTRPVEWHRCDTEPAFMGMGAPFKRLHLRPEEWGRLGVRQALWLMGDCPRPGEDGYTPARATKDLFLPTADFERFLHLLRTRRNLILQGPPGTGKTFIAKRLAWCLIGRKDSDPIEMVQFHQSYAYEDFVQGYRPTESGGFELRNGVFHRFCERARAKPGTPHVFIIDEINRGNLSRIFGELLMLIESDKRSEEYGVSLTYARADEKRFHIPANVHILGMMNTADRSLALVDYALRRRFAFATLEPAYGTKFGRGAMREYLESLDPNPVPAGLVERIIKRMAALNAEIEKDTELGRGFRIGHSYFVPGEDVPPEGGVQTAFDDEWYETIVDTQIAPLLEEYWFDSPEKVSAAVDRLKRGD